jgi:hypothetical protein
MIELLLTDESSKFTGETLGFTKPFFRTFNEAFYSLLYCYCQSFWLIGFTNDTYPAFLALENKEPIGRGRGYPALI